MRLISKSHLIKPNSMNSYWFSISLCIFDCKILSLIRHSFQDGYEYATTDQLEFELCDIDDVTAQKDHSKQKEQSRSKNYSDCYKKLEDDTILYECDECERTFTRSIGLKRHQNRDHQTTNRTQIVKLHKLQVHEKLHPSNKCVQCHKKFDSPSRLADHMNVHLSKKPHACDQCDKSFTHPSNLSAHKRVIHRKIRPYVCHICERNFSCRTNLNYHLGRHMVDKPYACNLCEKSFSQILQLSKHKKMLHRTTGRHLCKLCDQSFVCTTNLRRHLTNNHQIENKFHAWIEQNFK